MTTQTVCKHIAEPKKDENIKYGKVVSIYRMVLVRQAFHVPSVPVQGIYSCVQDCVKITEEGKI
jgi:hypothetical protein